MKKLFLNWLLVVSVGNCVSFAVPALVAVTMNILIGESGNSFTTFVPIGVMMLAGSIEGVVLGFAQWLVLHHYLHKLTFWGTLVQCSGAEDILMAEPTVGEHIRIWVRQERREQRAVGDVLSTRPPWSRKTRWPHTLPTGPLQRMRPSFFKANQRTA
jgi:hypothetical protein